MSLFYRSLKYLFYSFFIWFFCYYFLVYQGINNPRIFDNFGKYFGSLSSFIIFGSIFLPYIFLHIADKQKNRVHWSSTLIAVLLGSGVLLGAGVVAIYVTACALGLDCM